MSEKKPEGDKPENKKSEVTPFRVGSLFVSANFMRTAFMQSLVIRELYEPPAFTRLSAFRATLQFSQGSVMSGANLGIQFLYGFFGGVGQNAIGHFFGDRQTQSLMRNMVTHPANRMVGGGEHSYWVTRYNFGIASLRNFVLTRETFQALLGGFFGSAASVNFRAQFQFYGATLRQSAPRLLEPRVIMRCYGAVGTGGFFFFSYLMADWNGIVQAINFSDVSKYKSPGGDDGPF